MMANMLVVGMLALTIGLVVGIFYLEYDWSESDNWYLSNLGEARGGGGSLVDVGKDERWMRTSE